MGAEFKLFLAAMLCSKLEAVSPPNPEHRIRTLETRQPHRRSGHVRRITTFIESMLAYNQGVGKMVAVAKSFFSADNEDISRVFPGLVTMASRIKCDYCALTVSGWLSAEISELDAFHLEKSPSCPAAKERASRADAMETDDDDEDEDEIDFGVCS